MRRQNQLQPILPAKTDSVDHRRLPDSFGTLLFCRSARPPSTPCSFGTLLFCRQRLAGVGDTFPARLFHRRRGPAPPRQPPPHHPSPASTDSGRVGGCLVCAVSLLGDPTQQPSSQLTFSPVVSAPPHTVVSAAQCTCPVYLLHPVLRFAPNSRPRWAAGSVTCARDCAYAR